MNKIVLHIIKVNNNHIKCNNSAYKLANSLLNRYSPNIKYPNTKYIQTLSNHYFYLQNHLKIDESKLLSYRPDSKTFEILYYKIK
jgi:hypothetical protein